MIYFIITTSVYNDCKKRKNQYLKCINRAKEIIKEMGFDNLKIIIVENNGEEDTYLNSLNCEIFYTNNNLLPTGNKGIKELQDIFDCIQKYNIEDDDLIVKMTGRYLLHNESKFMTELKKLDETKYDCILKYGAYFSPSKTQVHDCITGLICMKCSYVKKIVMPTEFECVEWKWADATYLMDDKKICALCDLGIDICPGSNTYFTV